MVTPLMVRSAVSLSAEIFLVTMVICGLLAGVLALFTPMATGILVDKVIPNGRTDELLQLTLLLGAAAVGVAAFQLVRSLALLRLEGRLGNAAEAAVIDRLLNLPAPFFRVVRFRLSA